MKVRNGFISNSSSSSFIVNCSDIFVIPHMPKLYRDKTTLLVPYTFGGNFEFGRERENYKDFGSRLNFAYLIAKSLENTKAHEEKWSESFITRIREGEIYKEQRDHLEMLEEVLLESIPGLKRVEWMLREAEFDVYDKNSNINCGYIDHGSNWHEKPENFLGIFESKDTIFNWLFGVDNYIANRSDEYEDSDEPEVNHCLDYAYDFEDENGDYKDLYFNPWKDPEKFDKDGNFIE